MIIHFGHKSQNYELLKSVSTLSGPYQTKPFDMIDMNNAISKVFFLFKGTWKKLRVKD